MYNGMPISEWRLVALAIVYATLFLLLLVVLVLWGSTALSMKDPKEKALVKRLKEKAETDSFAQKRLAKIERRQKRERRNTRADRILFCLSVAFCLVILVCAVLPTWTDFLRKDYVVYTGEVTVVYVSKNSRVMLADGTTVWGIGDLEEGDTYGTVVYSRRSKQLLSGQKCKGQCTPLSVPS